jgi:hypothetical protein
MFDGRFDLRIHLRSKLSPRHNRSYDDDALPTARTTLRTGYARVLVFCCSCRRQADADMQALVDAGRGDVPLTELRFRCSQCGTGNTDFVVTSRDNPQPW